MAKASEPEVQLTFGQLVFNDGNFPFVNMSYIPITGSILIHSPDEYVSPLYPIRVGDTLCCVVCASISDSQ